MNIDQLYPSTFLKAEDIKGKNVTVIIEKITMEKVGDDGDKPVLHFVGKDRGLVLNKTNAGMIAHFYGDETDHWAGKQIGLIVEPVSFAGKIVDAIRVKINNNMMTPQPAPQPVQQPVSQPVQQPVADFPDDDIPF